MVNLASKKINMTPRQTKLLSSSLSSPLTVHTIPEFPNRNDGYTLLQKKEEERGGECDLMV